MRCPIRHKGTNSMKKVMGNKVSIAVFVLPAFLIYFVFVLIPIGYNIYMSFFKTDLMSPGTMIGLRNYENLMNDKVFFTALKNNLQMVVGSLAAHLIFALLLAALLFQIKNLKGGSIFQTIFFLPNVLCGVAVGLTWTFIYHGNFGIINQFLTAIGREDMTRVWLNSKPTAMISIIVVVMWQFVGYHMVIQLAGMKNISGNYYEAAKIDGAGNWQQFRYITLPLISPILKIDAVLIITGSLKYYDLVSVMTGGGPNHATELMSTYMFYEGFRLLKYGYSAAIGVILLLLCICAVILSNFVFRSDNTEY